MAEECWLQLQSWAMALPGAAGGLERGCCLGEMHHHEPLNVGVEGRGSRRLVDSHGHSGGQEMRGDSSETTGEWALALWKGPELKNSTWECLGGQLGLCLLAGWGHTWELLSGAAEAGLGAVILPAVSPRLGTALLQTSCRSIS